MNGSRAHLDRNADNSLEQHHIWKEKQDKMEEDQECQL